MLEEEKEEVAETTSDDGSEAEGAEETSTEETAAEGEEEAV